MSFCLLRRQSTISTQAANRSTDRKRQLEDVVTRAGGEDDGHSGPSELEGGFDDEDPD